MVHAAIAPQVFRYGSAVGVLALSLVARGQFGMGAAGGSWEGIWGLHHQPASILLHQDRMEVGVVRAGADGYANFLLLDPQRLGILNFNDGLVLDGEGADEGASGPGAGAMIVDMRAQGPSVARRLGHHGAWAFTMAGRSNYVGVDPRRLVSKFGADTVRIEEGAVLRLTDVDMIGSTATWAEGGLTYGRTFNDAGKVRIHAAATAKYVVGGRAGHFVVAPPMVTGLTDSTTAITQVDLDHALALPDQWTTAGRGWNADIGAIFEVMKRDWAPDLRPYWLRFGVALTDLGTIGYKEGARVHRIRGGSTTSEDLSALHVGHVDALDTALSTLLLGDPGRSLAARSFSMGLPAALHLSMEFCPVRHWAIRAEGVLAMRRPPEALATRDLLAIVPRFETRMFSAAIPFTMDRDGARAIGLCLRLGGVMVGSDRLGGLVGLTDAAGADLYCGVKLRFKERTAQ